MRDLATIRYENAYAADVEEQKAGRIGATSAVIAAQVWPSDAPAIPRHLNTLKQRDPELYREKAYLRRLALFKGALRRGATL